MQNFIDFLTRLLDKGFTNSELALCFTLISSVLIFSVWCVNRLDSERKGSGSKDIKNEDNSEIVSEELDRENFT